MTTAIIITFCCLVLIAYLFDITAPKTKIPTVILLLIVGFGLKELAKVLRIDVPDLSDTLPLLGTVGLILIVMEGALELQLNKEKLSIVRKSIWGSLIPIILLGGGIAYAFHLYSGYPLKDCITNALPLCIISSAIAIPTVRNLSKQAKEFITFESSLSDIIGVIIFNFFALNEMINAASVGEFFLQLIAIVVISLIATLLLAFLFKRINHHIKFLPIIFMVILIYTIAKAYHLPALIFILIFGLFLGNLDELKRYSFINKFDPDNLEKEVHKFHEITIEFTFLIRSLFFLVFGYLIKAEEVLNTATIGWAGAIVAAILVIRVIQLKISKLPLHPLAFIAPRGLITVLLFVSITPAQAIPIMNQSLIIQVILLCALIMMIGIMTTKTRP